MLRRHEDQLTNRLEELYYEGTCKISWSELYSWFSSSKITKKTWRELWDRWIAFADGGETLGDDPRSSPAYPAWLKEHQVDLIENKNSGCVVLVYKALITNTLSDREFS